MSRLLDAGELEEDHLDAVGVQQQLLGPHGAHRLALVHTRDVLGDKLRAKLDAELCEVLPAGLERVSDPGHGGPHHCHEAGHVLALVPDLLSWVNILPDTQGREGGKISFFG